MHHDAIELLIIAICCTQRCAFRNVTHHTPALLLFRCVRFVRLSASLTKNNPPTLFYVKVKSIAKTTSVVE